jgi:threonine/homoserine/homoserine lactone efflux protein
LQRTLYIMVIQGVIWGISLSFMIGPLLFSIIEAGIAQGFRAGLAVAIGIWLSDVLYVAAVMSGVEILAGLTALPGFKLWSGIIGGCLLVAFGLGSLLKAYKKAQLNHPENGRKQPAYSWLEYCMRGFLVNTVNPFTVFFWLSIVGAVVIPNGWNNDQTLWFFCSMLGTLVITDTLKAYAAREISRFLTPQHTLWVQRGIGILLLIFGVVLIVRVL